MYVQMSIWKILRRHMLFLHLTTYVGVELLGQMVA